MTSPMLATLRRHRDTVMTGAQIATTVSHTPTRRASVWRWAGPLVLIAFGVGMWAGCVVTLAAVMGGAK